MALNKLRELDGTTHGVTLPRDDFRLDGLVSSDGDLDGEHLAHVRREGPREYRITILPQEGI